MRRPLDSILPTAPDIAMISNKALRVDFHLLVYMGKWYLSQRMGKGGKYNYEKNRPEEAAGENWVLSAQGTEESSIRFQEERN